MAYYQRFLDDEQNGQNQSQGQSTSSTGVASADSAVPASPTEGAPTLQNPGLYVNFVNRYNANKDAADKQASNLASNVTSRGQGAASSLMGAWDDYSKKVNSGRTTPQTVVDKAPAPIVRTNPTPVAEPPAKKPEKPTPEEIKRGVVQARGPHGVPVEDPDDVEPPPESKPNPSNLQSSSVDQPQSYESVYGHPKPVEADPLPDDVLPAGALPTPVVKVRDTYFPDAPGDTTKAPGTTPPPTPKLSDMTMDQLQALAASIYGGPNTLADELGADAYGKLTAQVKDASDRANQLGTSEGRQALYADAGNPNSAFDEALSANSADWSTLKKMYGGLSGAQGKIEDAAKKAADSARTSTGEYSDAAKSEIGGRAAVEAAKDEAAKAEQKRKNAEAHKYDKNVSFEDATGADAAYWLHQTMTMTDPVTGIWNGISGATGGSSEGAPGDKLTGAIEKQYGNPMGDYRQGNFGEALKGSLTSGYPYTDQQQVTLWNNITQDEFDALKFKSVPEIRKFLNQRAGELRAAGKLK